MQTIVQFSGGKDSTAALIYTIKNITKKPLIIFCDTGFEAQETYDYIDYVEQKINIKIERIKSAKFPEGMVQMSNYKKRFPSTKARFCTEELKIKPMIDFILNLNDHFIAIQGIRKDESLARSKMNKQCTYFKFYFEPYNDKGKKHTYRGKEVRKLATEKAADVIRPIFEWTGNEVMNYILENGFKINPLYKKGFKRVGCFPCVSANNTDIKNLNRFFPERIKEISKFEKQLNSSFFPPGKIPKRFCANKSHPTINEVVKYVSDTEPQLFKEIQEKEQSCLSFYNICE